MPPVLGPASPSPARLKSCAGARATAVRPSHTASTDSSGPVMPSSMTTVRPASPKLVPASFAWTSSSASMSESVTSTPLPAARPSVLTTHGAGSDRRKSSAGLGVGRRCRGRRWARRRRPPPPSSTPSSPRAGRRRRRARTPARRRARSRSASPSTSGASGPTTTRSASSSSARRPASDEPGGMPGLPGRDDDLGGAGQHVGEGVLPPAGARRRRPSCALAGATARRSGAARGRRRRS